MGHSVAFLGGVRRFFTLEARPEDVRLRQDVRRLLKDGLQFMPWRQAEKTLHIALGEYESYEKRGSKDEEL